MNTVEEFPPGGTVDFKFNTHQGNGTPITLAGSPAISVYKDNDIAESVAGVTLTVDFDGRTGLHHGRIVLTDAFYTMNSKFQAVLTAGSVDGISVVGTVLKEFKVSPLAVNAAAIIYGTVSASPPPSNTTMTAAVNIVPTVADQFKGRIIVFAHDTTTTSLRGQFTNITASSAPGVGEVGLTFVTLTTLPQAGDRFIII